MRRRPWVGAALLATVLIASSGTASPVSASPVSASASPQAPTPLLSVRRDPAWIESTIAGQRLKADLGPVVTRALGNPATASSCVEVSQGPNVLYSFNPDKELLPASNMKLLTDTALLDKLGPSRRLTTKVEAGAPTAGGVLHGNLYLVGGGDPLLMTNAYVQSTYMPGVDPSPPIYTSLDQLAAQVRKAGIKMVTGSVLGDDSRFDAERTVATWDPVYITEGDSALLSSLEVDYNMPPTAAGSVPIPPGSAPSAPSPAPALNAASIFTSLLKSEGVAVVGAAATGKAPVHSPVVTEIQSPPLSAEVQSMLRISDDTAAELLTKELGFEVSGKGSTAAGTEAVKADLQKDGFPANQLANPDGSGLDRGDRATCNLIDQVLTRDGPKSVLAAGLPVAAKTGTLLHRLNGTAASGRLTAKTGTLGDVAALSGFIEPPPSASDTGIKSSLVFSIIVNGPNFTLGEATIDKLAAAIASYYPEAPAMSAVEAVP